MRIFGAGIAGLLAGSIFQTAEIFEAGPTTQATHKAVLRFRSSEVGDAVGVEFRKVRVHKGIWMEAGYVRPEIRLANWYSQKVIGRLADRSIWNLEPADRFVAPEDFIARLIERCHNRIHWDHTLTEEDVIHGAGADEPIISTLPMSVLVNWLGERRMGTSIPAFNNSPISVQRWRIPGADVFQTVYFPDPTIPLYRASITGDLLIAEYVKQSSFDEDHVVNYSLEFPSQLMFAFGIEKTDVIKIDSASQRFGKIAPIDESWRRYSIYHMTSRYNIFSLGRFGTWRNILLDDVIKDINVIKRLLASDIYGRAHINAR